MSDKVLANDGYPSEDELDSIVYWNAVKHPDAEALMSYIRARWKYGGCGYWDEVLHDVNGEAVHCYKISTGGWSGNEEIIAALRENDLFWAMHWYSHTRGGHYEFQVHQNVGRPALDKPHYDSPAEAAAAQKGE